MGQTAVSVDCFLNSVKTGDMDALGMLNSASAIIEARLFKTEY